MAKIRIDLSETLLDGMDIKFKAPCACNEITGLIVFYPAEDETTKSKEFVFRDAHGNDLTGIGNLFSKDVYVKVIVDVENGYAYLQNADTNGYLNSAIFGTYIHDSENLIGRGENGKFKATVGGTISNIKVNGVNYSVKCGEDSTMDLVAGCWYTFILDGNTVNFNSGGTGGLNFKVVGGTTVPVSPRENMIWVNTKEIAGYYFSAEQPENMQPNEVWISTGTASSVAFNAAKKNTIMIYPIAAKQMVNGSLVDVTAKSYQGGKWVEWAVFLFKDGKDITDVTGGWTGYAATPLQYAVAPSVEIANGLLHIYYTNMGIGGSGIGATEKLIDLSNANTLHLTIDSVSDFINAKVGVWTISNTVATLVKGNDDVTTAGTLVLDVKDLDGSYYVGAMIGRKSGDGVAEIYFSEIHYE